MGHISNCKPLEAYALRLLGDIAAHREPPESAQAESYYQQARTLAKELGMHPLQATATGASARCIPRSASRSTRVPRYLRPSRCTGPWT
jgi:hypothetical protein